MSRRSRWTPSIGRNRRLRTNRIELLLMTNVTCVPSEQRPPIKRLDPFIIRRSNGASDPSVTTSRWLACHHDGHARNKQKIAQMFQADRENVHRPNRTRRNRIRSPDFFFPTISTFTRSLTPAVYFEWSVVLVQIPDNSGNPWNAATFRFTAGRRR